MFVDLFTVFFFIITTLQVVKFASQVVIKVTLFVNLYIKFVSQQFNIRLAIFVRWLMPSHFLI